MEASLNQRWNELVDEAEAASARFPATETMLRARREGLTIDGEALDFLAARFEREPEGLRELRDFLEDVAKGAEPLRLCRGLSCKTRGSRPLHAAILATRPEDAPTDLPECMDHCDVGPTLAIGERTYCGAAEEIRLEERTWRRHGQGA